MPPGDSRFGRDGLEDEDVFVIVVALAAHASVARAQVTLGQIVRQRRLFALDRLAVPRAVLPVRGDNDPLLAQRMPSFFPDHKHIPYFICHMAYEIWTGLPNKNSSRSLVLIRVSPSTSYTNVEIVGSGACARRRLRSALPFVPSSRRNRSRL